MSIQSMIEIICTAIRNKHRIQFEYHDKLRIGEPQACGVSKKGKDIARVHLIEGGSRPEQLFEIAQMKSLKLLNEHFIKPGPNYKKNDSAMREIYCQL